MSKVAVFAGDLVSFVYKGGENPGQKRTVLILSDSTTRSKTFQAYCFTRNSIRTFSLSKVDSVEGLRGDAYYIHELSFLPKSLQDGSVMAKAYEAEGKSTYIYDGFLYAVNPPAPKSYVHLNMGEWGTYLIVLGKNGKTGNINITGQTNAELIKQLQALEL